jgi:glycosyltransferase involved in cell wall biosynthesis
MHQFSILTPTYNRAKYLPRIYDCLCQQGDIDFEWIIVDDGSSDNTREVVSGFERKFEIKYTYQENAGKPTAMNVGLQMANSYITLFSLDDEDILYPNVLKTVWSYFDIKTGRFDQGCVCLTGLCRYNTGEISGGEFPHDYIISDYIRYVQNRGIGGDRCEFFITNILKQYPFPIIENEKNIAPSIILARIALTHKTIYVNQVFQEKQHLEGGLSSQNYKMKYPLGAELLHNEKSIPPYRLKLQLNNTVSYIYYAKINHKKNIFKNAKNKKIYPFGFCKYCVYKFRLFLEEHRLLKK